MEKRNAARVAQIQRKMVWNGPKIMLLAQNRELLHESVFSAAVTKNFVGKSRFVFTHTAELCN
jgi:hypothetical protein